MVFGKIFAACLLNLVLMVGSILSDQGFETFCSLRGYVRRWA